MVRRREPTLKGIVTVTVIAVVSLAVLAALQLVLVTTSLHSATVELAANVESVRVAGEIELNLLRHARASDAAVRAEIEGALRQGLRKAVDYVTTPEEMRVLRRVEEGISRYLASPEAADTSPGVLDEAYLASDAFARVNMDQARETLRDAERWDRRANMVGTTAIIVVIAIASVLVWWLNGRAFRPTLAIAGAMERFSAGDRGARADEVGPRELKEMARQFNDMAAELSAQRERQMAFLAGVAHDLRNPLSTLSCAVAAFAPPKGGASTEDVSRMLQLLRRQIGRLDRMVGDLLEITRIEAGRLEIAPIPCEIGALVHDVVTIFRSTLSKHEIVVACREPAWVRCDALRIEQVLNNLISNAVKYSPNGGLVEVALSTSGDMAVISVKDEGLGISAADRPRLFEPFRRSKRDSESSIPGTGLGLFVARRIVEAHDGRIEVDSAEGKGTTVRVYLPRMRQAPVGEMAMADATAR
jgi:signal transduction histidine kinase